MLVPPTFSGGHGNPPLLKATISYYTNWNLTQYRLAERQAPLCKGSCHRKVTEGLFLCQRTYFNNNPSEFRFAKPTSPYTGEATPNRQLNSNLPFGYDLYCRGGSLAPSRKILRKRACQLPTITPKNLRLYRRGRPPGRPFYIEIIRISTGRRGGSAPLGMPTPTNITISHYVKFQFILLFSAIIVS